MDVSDTLSIPVFKKNKNDFFFTKMDVNENNRGKYIYY